MDYTVKLAYQSNYWYNDGLAKAQVRDMSGAITSLKKSLQYTIKVWNMQDRVEKILRLSS